MKAASYDVMDEALEALSRYGPDLANGMTSHAPMAVEALCAMGRAEAAMPWVENYRKGMLLRPAVQSRISRDDWRSALAQANRTADWSAFFVEEMREAPWQEVLNRWTGRLAPAICASATHGVIRVGHAVRSLDKSESPLRLQELADGLGYWAANYQELPTAGETGGGMNPREAIAQVAVVPPASRRFTGTIVSSLEALNEFPGFAPAIALLDVAGDPQKLVSELTEVFSRVYLANAHDFLTSIVFVHGVTSIAALGNILPHLDDPTARQALRYAWQASCGLYAAFGSHPTPSGEIKPPDEKEETLIDMAIATEDEHAIKFAEACLAQYARNSSPAYLAAARHAIDALVST